MLRLERPMRAPIQLGPLVRLGSARAGIEARASGSCFIEASLAALAKHYGRWCVISARVRGGSYFNKVGSGVGSTTHWQICQARLARPCRNNVPQYALQAVPDEKVGQPWCSRTVSARVYKKSAWCTQEGNLHVSLVIRDEADVGTLGWLLAQGLTLPACAIGSCLPWGNLLCV